MRKILFILIAIFSFNFVFAETIKLNDGTIITGDVIAFNDETVIVKTDYGQLEIPKSNIQNIDYNTVQPEENKQVIQEEKEETKNVKQEYAKNDAFLFRPLTLFAGIYYNGIDFAFDGLTAFTQHFALNALFEWFANSQMYSISYMLGPQFNLGKKCLDGIYLGLYPGFIWGTNGFTVITDFELLSEIGWQHVANNGFVFTVYTGALLLPEVQLKYGIKIGFAYKSPFVKIKKEEK